MNIYILIPTFAALLSINTLSDSRLNNTDLGTSTPTLNISTPSNTRFEEYSDDSITRNIKNLFNATTNENLNTKEYNWYFKAHKDGTPTEAPKETINFVPKYDTHYLGDPSKKVLYLTFDEGYENGYTAPILDVLKKHNVKAAFFVVRPYITSNPDLIKRMVEDGHLVCNHSARHPSMASILEVEKFNKELSDVEEAYEKVTGQKMPKYFRPPMGKYSELSLYYTQSYGYKTVFWTFAYKDWEIKNQPTLEYAKNKILKGTHNGTIILLHAVSETNAKILDSVITEWKNQGYEIKGLDELPK